MEQIIHVIGIMKSEVTIQDGAQLAGSFAVGRNRRIIGEIALNGANSRALLQSDRWISLSFNGRSDIRGTLRDGRSIALLGCLVLSSGSGRGKSQSTAELRPLYIVVGDVPFPSRARPVSAIRFKLDDAEQIFNDFDAFGHSLEPESFIKEVVEANERRIGRKIPLGAHPDIAYFTGKAEIAEVVTPIGRISVLNDPHPLLFCSPKRVGIENRVIIELAFRTPQPLHVCVERLNVLLRFFQIVSGRPQNLELIGVETAASRAHRHFELYWCDHPRRSTDWEQRTPHPAEILLDAVGSRPEFERVLAKWIARDSKWRSARVRFSEGFQRQRKFTIDRLIGAANMFDILPRNAFRTRVRLPKEIRIASEEARGIFKKLPRSDPRDSVLGALGRLGKPTLRTKIQNRAQLVEPALKGRLTNLDEVLDEAVKCRNFFVHGSPGSFDYSVNNHTVSFMTRALEFIFAASDLLECGWDIQRWLSQGNSLVHPFNELLHIWQHEAEEIVQLRARK